MGNLRTINGFVGTKRLVPVDVYVYDITSGRNSGLSWYVQDGGTYVNLADTRILEDNVCIDAIEDIDCISSHEGINSEEELDEFLSS